MKYARIKAKLWGFGRSPMVFGVWEGVGGGRLVLKTASPGTATPSITGRCSAASDSIGRCELQKMEHSNLGLRRDGASINEGKDPERVGHLEQSADQGLGRVGRHAVAGLHGRSAGTRGRQGRSIGSSLSSGRTLGPLPQSRRTCPRSL